MPEERRTSSDPVPDPSAAARPWYPAPEIETAITRGLLWPGAARRALLSEAAVAAAAELADPRVGPFPVEFLAYVSEHPPAIRLSTGLARPVAQP
jgi:hypothetical protein